MSDLKVRVSIELPINVTLFIKGRAQTRWEPADPDEVDFGIDAPEPVANWILDHLDDEALQDIETEIIEQAERNHAQAIAEWAESREER